MTQCEIFTAEKSFRFRFSMWGFRMNSLVAILEEATNHDPMKNLEPDRVKILAWNNQTLSSYYAKLAILFMLYRMFVFIENIENILEFETSPSKVGIPPFLHLQQ